MTLKVMPGGAECSSYGLGCISNCLTQDLRPFGKVRAGSGLLYAAPTGLGLCATDVSLL